MLRMLKVCFLIILDNHKLGAYIYINQKQGKIKVLVNWD